MCFQMKCKFVNSYMGIRNRTAIKDHAPLRVSQVKAAIQAEHCPRERGGVQQEYDFAIRVLVWCPTF